MPIPELDNFRSKYPGYNDLSDADLASKLASKYPDSYGDLPGKIKPTGAAKTTTDTTEVPEWGRKYPNLYGLAGAAREAIGPILEAAGVVGGGAVGAAAGTAASAPTGFTGALPLATAGGVAGAGLGYAGAHQLLNQLDVALGNKKDKGIVETAKEVPGQVATGAAMEAGGQVAGKALESGVTKIAEKAQPVAEKMYASALKLGTGKALTQAERAARIKTGLEIGAVPTEKGLAKVGSLIDEIDNAIQAPITEAAGQGKTINADKVISHLEGIRDTFAKQANPKPDLDIIDSTIQGFKDYHGQEIPIDLAQEIKRGTYLQLKGKYGKLGNAGIEAEKGLARGLKEEIYSTLEQDHPELKSLGQKEGAYLALNQSLENAVKRIQNRDIIGIGTPIATTAGKMIAGTPGAFAGFVAKVIDMPIVKSRLAIAISKGAKNLGEPALSKAAAYASGAIGAKQALDQGMPDITPSAEAGSLQDLRRHNQAIVEAGRDEHSPSPVAAQAAPQQEYVSPAKVKQRADGTWVKWDNYNQAWLKMTPQEIKEVNK